MVDRSTVGEAGLSRETATARPVNTTTPTTAHSAIRRVFMRLMSGRAISIAVFMLHLGCQERKTCMLMKTFSFVEFVRVPEGHGVTGSAFQLFEFGQ
jgi:hypothetical protein